MRLGGLFALPPGAVFAEDFADGLIARSAGEPPDALARTTIYVNSGKTLTSLRAALERRGPLLLPRLRLIAELGEGPLASPLARRLDLGALISGLVAARPALSGGQAVPVLARSLAALMAELQSEGCPPDALDRLDVGEHAEHWRAAQDFLRIAAGWYLDGPPRDREARQRAAAEALSSAWADGHGLPDGPVIVAGSTGSHGATRLFMQAVARLPQGAVVLPGFDFAQPSDVWQTLVDRGDDHPQARFAPLVAEFGVPQQWHAGGAVPSTRRGRLISLALRPAPVTDQWIAEGPELGDLMDPTSALTLIEAPDPQSEAAAIAVAIREAVEDGVCVTLIAADRLLTRRVAAALDRWEILPDDSAGQPLSLTVPGLFLRQVAALHGRPLAVDGLLALLKNPVAASGMLAVGGDEQAARGDHLRFTRDLELHLRRRGPAFPDGDFLRRWPKAGDPARQNWAAWLAHLVEAIAPLAGDRAARPLPDRLSQHRALAEALAAGPDGSAAASALWARQAGGLARSVLDHLAAQARADHLLTAHDFAALLDGELQAQAMRAEAPPHPLVRFRGPREARTEATGLVILGGLNEGSWPQAPSPDPWLSRQMRQSIGLTLPERLIGLAAHDFQQAIAASRVILTRARRDAEAETVPSRWLNRLVNLMAGLPDQDGPQALAAMRQRGTVLLALADALGRPQAMVPPAPRPAPLPPAPAFKQLSVTAVATLIRDPYALYARTVLGLQPLAALHPQADASLRGEVFHEIARQFLTPAPAAGTPPDALAARFLAIADEVLAQEVPWPAARAFWAFRLRKIMPRLMKDEASRLAEGTPTIVERRAEYPVPGLPLTLVARPDRIDELWDGTAHVYDYKSGAAPTEKKIEAYDKQLPLTAALLTRGAFGATGARMVSGMSYIRLGSEGATEARTMPPDEIDATWDRFTVLLRRYLTQGAAFTARRSAGEPRYATDYDHLARFGEWTPATPPTIIRLNEDPS